MTARPSIAVIVPAHNAAWCISDCLTGLRAAGFDLRREVTVVDDGSTDQTAQLVASAGLRSHATARGAAAARQTGAANQTADILLFVDSDVVVAPDTKAKIETQFEETSTDAVFGAYDATPRHPSWISQYRNLLHRHVHVTSAGPAQTFWTGLGAVRRPAYEAVGGIDPSQRMMEDVELGMRLNAAGFSITLEPEITGTHLKTWTWRSMVKTDLWDRAIPWARLLADAPDSFANLNLSKERKVTALASVGIGLGLALLPFHLSGLIIALISLVIFTGLSWPLLAWLARLKGPAFAAFSVLPHILHNWCAVAGFAYVKITHFLPGARSTPALNSKG